MRDLAASSEFDWGHNDLPRLLFNYLRISPSYALVCSSSSRRLTRGTPEASRRVIETFRKYGDVYCKSFDAWRGPHLAVSGNTTLPDQGLVGQTDYRKALGDTFITLSIPRNLPLKQQLSECERLLRRSKASVEQISRVKIRSKTLWKALAAVYERAKHPDVELWRVGLLANCVERFNGQLDAWATKKLAQHAEMRRHLTLIVVRALFLALLVAENAAHGAFPERSAFSGPQLEFPFAELELHNRLMALGDEEYQEICKHTAAFQTK